MNYLLSKLMNVDVDTLFKWVARLWVAWVILVLAIMGVIIWTAIHFAAKFW